jgi:hypothetical protein
MERLDVPEFLRFDHHSSLCFDVAPFLVDLDGGKPFRETIGEVDCGGMTVFPLRSMKPYFFPNSQRSSLLHVLIVTPVIVTWLRERELSRKESAPPAA